MLQLLIENKVLYWCKYPSTSCLVMHFYNHNSEKLQARGSRKSSRLFLTIKVWAP